MVANMIMKTKRALGYRELLESGPQWILRPMTIDLACEIGVSEFKLLTESSPTPVHVGDFP